MTKSDRTVANEVPDPFVADLKRHWYRVALERIPGKFDDQRANDEQKDLPDESAAVP